MKGRVIGALWIAGALLICFFGFGGAYFNALIAFCILMSAAEILIISVGQPWRMEPLACQPYGVWAWQLLVLFFALFGCLVLSRQQVAIAIILSTLTDVGAFAVGKLFGKHRADFASRISPKKTYEGFIGGIICSALTVFFCPLFGITLTPRVIIFLAAGGFFAELGDLIGSATKRQLGIKDSGDGLRVFPIVGWLEFPLRGHGGYLDRLDSISMVLMFLAILLAP